METESTTQINYTLERLKWNFTKWMFLIGMPFLVLFITEYQAGVIQFGMPFSATQVETTKASHPKTKYTKKNACIDGYVYDNKNAPIYKGSHGKQARKLRKYMRPILKKKDYEAYIDILVAICYVESTFGAGDNSNWMQVRSYHGESGIRSVDAGISHFIQLLEQNAKPQNCKDISIVIQSYNYGHGYLKYCMQHGGVDTATLRSSFQSIQGGHYGNRYYSPKVLSLVKGKKIRKKKKK